MPLLLASGYAVEQFVAALIARWVAFCVRHPWPVLAAVLVCTTAAAGFAASTLRLEPDATKLIDRDAQFLQDYDAYKAAYLQHWRLNIVVIDGPDARTVREVEARLLEGMAAQPDLFRQVAAPGRNEFLARHALLFLPVDTLERVVDRLSEAQPALAAMAPDPSLRGLARLFGRAAGQADPPGEDLARLAGLIADTAAGVAGKGAGIVSWSEIILGPALAPHRRLIIFQGGRDDSDLEVSRRQEREVRQMAAHLAPPGSAVTIRMTGRGPLSATELDSALDSVQIAGLISLGFVVLLLWAGFGSLRAILAAVATLLVGLVATGAFAAAAVGTLNVLSMTFAVLFIGLGIDFAIHLILRLREEEARTAEGKDRWFRTAHGAGPTIALCGLTTAIAFLSFWPTAYRGLAELGVISAAGMAIAVVASFTVLPALLRVMRADGAGRPGAAAAACLPGQGRVGEFVTAHARAVAIAGLAAALLAAGVGVRVPFDFNTLNMQDPDSESVRTLLDLQADGTITPYTLTVRAPDIEAAEAVAARLRTLDSVAGVKTLADYVPADQDTKLAVIDELAILLGPRVLSGEPAPPPDDDARLAAVSALADHAAVLSARAADRAYARMAESLRGLAEGPGAAGRAGQLEALLATDFVDSLAMLRAATEAGPVTLADLPREIVEEETGSDGTVRVVATPREDLRDFEALGRFVRDVTALYPGATGRPALEEGVGRVVVDAFRDALLISAIAIFVLLVIVLRSVREAALVMAPLLLAAALTTATMVVLAIPLNVANVIVLPLLLGIGVDSGIHMIGRFREGRSVEAVFASSTPRAVLVSALTTLGSFVALAFSSHRGMASMGTLLGISIGYMLVCALIVLPALLAWYAGARVTDARKEKQGIRW